jgi:hypothetical protein
MTEDPRHDDVRPMTPVYTTANERWEGRYRLSEPQLIDAAAECLTFAGNILADKVAEADVQLWLLRGQWYMLRLDWRKRESWAALMSSTSLMPTGRILPDDASTRFSQMYPATGRDLSPSARPDHTERRKPQPQYVTSHGWQEGCCDRPSIEHTTMRHKAIYPTVNAEKWCPDHGVHGEHTWTTTDEDPGPMQTWTCPGIKGRPVRDNPQA